ncbi:hypothetical protein ACQZV8_07900 [Magnetococcales bacterium HHB-1]
MELTNGSRVAIIGGGPAGSFTAYYLLEFAQRLDIGKLHVDIYEPKDFSRVGAAGCNHCGGIISESLIQYMATEGILIPSEVIMNTIDSYALHNDSGRVTLHTPLDEMRIAAIFRGGGPKRARGEKNIPLQSFDNFLFRLACKQGANHIPERVAKLSWNNEQRPQVILKDKSVQTYDFLVGATGVNGLGTRLFENLNFGYRAPEKSKTFIMDFYLGEAQVAKYVGSTMHVFLLNIDGIKQGAIIPKGPFVTICFVTEDHIDNDLINQFVNHPEIKACLPPEWERPINRNICICQPKTNVGDPIQPFTDRVVLVGDCGVAKLFKDGIGSAYLTARVLAATAIIWGISAENFQTHFKPALDNISTDNRIGKAVLTLVSMSRKSSFLQRSMLSTAAQEQNWPGPERIMSMTLWDSFSGSAPYKIIFSRMIKKPLFFVHYFWQLIRSILGFRTQTT